MKRLVVALGAALTVLLLGTAAYAGTFTTSTGGWSLSAPTDPSSSTNHVLTYPANTGASLVVYCRDGATEDAFPAHTYALNTTATSSQVVTGRGCTAPKVFSRVLLLEGQTVRVEWRSSGYAAPTAPATGPKGTKDDPVFNAPASGPKGTQADPLFVNVLTMPDQAAAAPSCLAPDAGPTYEAVAAAPTCRIAMDDRALRLDLGGLRYVLLLGFGLNSFLLGWLVWRR